MTFNLSSLSFAVRRNFIDLVPLKDLTILRAQSVAAKSMSKFRGDFVNDLKVQTDASKDYHWFSFISYSEILNRQFNTTPLERLSVHMGFDIVPEALLSKMEKCYPDLYLTREYDWTDVIAFIHAGVRCVTLKGNMNLPVNQMEEFLGRLMKSNVKKVCFYNDNCKKSWLPTAFEIINRHIGVTVKSVELMEGYYPKVKATTDDSVIELVTVDPDYEFDNPMEGDFVYAEMDLFFLG